MYCKWNPKSFNEAPSSAPDTCTHKASAEGDEAKVTLCKNPKDQQSCQQDGCVWNMPAAVAPSTVENTCTHVAVDAQNTQKIALCKSVTTEQACN